MGLRADRRRTHPPRRRGHHRAGRPGAGARPASATSPRTASATACCSRHRCGRTRCSATRPSRRTPGGPGSTAPGPGPRTARDRRRVRRAHAEHRRHRAGAVGRQPAEAHHRPGAAWPSPTVLVAAHPTRGVDVGAQAAIWDQLRAARAAGLATVLHLGRPRGADRPVRHAARDLPRPHRRPTRPGDHHPRGARRCT